MNGPDAYRFLKAVSGCEEEHSDMEGLTRQQKTEKWMTYQTSGVPTDIKSLDDPKAAPAPSEPVHTASAERPRFGFYKDVIQQFDQAKRAFDTYNKQQANCPPQQPPQA